MRRNPTFPIPAPPPWPPTFSHRSYNLNLHNTLSSQEAKLLPPPLTVATPVPPPHDLTFHPLLSLNLEPPQPVYYASSRTTSPWNQTNRPRKVPLLYALCHVQPRNLHSGLQPPEIGKKTITPVITTWQLSPCCCQGLSRRRGSANKSGQVPAETTPPSPWAGAGASARERGRGEVRPWPRVRIGPVFGCPSPPPKKIQTPLLVCWIPPLVPIRCSPCSLRLEAPDFSLK